VNPPRGVLGRRLPRRTLGTAGESLLASALFAIGVSYVAASLSAAFRARGFGCTGKVLPS
jgi:hypothetical protein